VRGDGTCHTRPNASGTASARRPWAALALLPLCAFGPPGCANFWDEVTSRDFKIKNLFVKQEPLAVLRADSDGGARAKAILKLKEPARTGGTEPQQNEVMDILVKTATRDRAALCRLAAVQKLGEFKDARAPKALQDAFYQAGDFGAATEPTTRIQCQALTALGQTGDPEAVPFLVDKLREPPAQRSDLAQQRADRCMAAARALALFRDPRGTEALAQILQNNKEDLALRERAHQSLVASTGQDLPADYQAWEDYLHPKDGAPVEDRKKVKLAGLFSLF
jgi:hypothetical protein